jgi:hypothetical protein
MIDWVTAWQTSLLAPSRNEHTHEDSNDQKIFEYFCKAPALVGTPAKGLA